MKRPDYAPSSSIGAMLGAVIACIGGLFVFDVVRAIALWPNFRLLPHFGGQSHEATQAALFQTPKLSLICSVVCLPLGWFIGGWVGSRLAGKFRSQRAEMIGGLIGGLVPLIVIGLWGWQKVNSP